jgi:hypothetical protein
MWHPLRTLTSISTQWRPLRHSGTPCVTYVASCASGIPRATLASPQTHWRPRRHGGVRCSTVVSPLPHCHFLTHRCGTATFPAPQSHPVSHSHAPPPVPPCPWNNNVVTATTGSLHHSGDPGTTLASSVPQRRPLHQSGFHGATMFSPSPPPQRLPHCHHPAL